MFWRLFKRGKDTSDEAKKPKRTLLVLVYTEPAMFLLNPLDVRFNLIAVYYDKNWPSEDGAMFGKKYRGIGLGHGLLMQRETEQYAQEFRFDELIIKRLISKGETEEVSRVLISEGILVHC